MSLANDVKTVLSADATLMALLSGGAFADVVEISRQKTAGAFDTNGEIKPCVLVKEGVDVGMKPYRELAAVQTPIILYFYERDGYATIGPATDRTLALLHLSKVGTGTWEVAYESTVNHQRDQPLECSLMTMRFVATRHKL